MVGGRAVVVLVGLVIGLTAWVVPVGARGGPVRTPAEIELRRAEIAERLVAIDRELAALDARLNDLARLSAAADTDSSITLARQRQDSETRRGVLAGEQAAWLGEHARLAAVVTRNATGPLQPADPRGLTSMDLAPQGGQATQSNQVTAGQAFNPAISVIPDIAYYYDDVSGDGLASTAGQGVDSGLERGFNLREMEIAFSGAVDPYFDVWATLAVSTDAIEAEEVYVQTRKLLPGLQLRVGKFLSGVGYLNKQHPHQWEFADQVLPFETILGGNLSEVGLQVTWLPNLPTYVQLGFEALQGDNDQLSQQAANQYPDVFEDRPGPRLFTGFLKVAPDLGYSHALQGGVSCGRSRSHQEAVEEDGLLAEALDGGTWFIGTDMVWRYDSALPFGQADVAVQAEYLYRRKDLDRVAIGEMSPMDGSPLVFNQDGLYAQATYGIAQRWTLGGRVDVVGLTNRVETSGGIMHADRSRRFSAALTFNPTEFSRIRVQYNTGEVRTPTPKTVNQVFVQFQMSLGVHGAHRF